MPQNVTPSTSYRFREIVDRQELLDDPVTPAELRERCVVIRGGAAGDGATVPVVRELLPWMALWYDHPSWRTGVWRCVVDTPAAGPAYTAYRRETLDFHTDMSRYVRPPEYTVIRCITPDQTGGDNLVLHVDDILAELERAGRQDVVDMLARPRALNVERRHLGPGAPSTAPGTDAGPVLASIATGGRPDEPIRVFDRHAASKGSHLELDAGEGALLDEFVRACGSSPGLSTRVRLGRHDTLVFSNWRMLHARLRCEGSGRVTEICMGNTSDPGRSPRAATAP